MRGRVNYAEFVITPTQVRNNLQACYIMWALGKAHQIELLNLIVLLVIVQKQQDHHYQHTETRYSPECCHCSTNSVSFNFQNPTPAGDVRVKQVATHFILLVEQMKNVHLKSC